MYKAILNEFISSPRDVQTVPLTRQNGKWFYVFVEDDKLCVESGHQKFPKCTLRKRVLPERECEALLSLYHRRQKGEPVSQEAHKCTYSQVYWYGIFSEMNL